MQLSGSHLGHHLEILKVLNCDVEMSTVFLMSFLSILNYKRLKTEITQFSGGHLGHHLGIFYAASCPNTKRASVLTLINE